MSRASWHDGRVRRSVLVSLLLGACAQDEPSLPIPVGDEAAELDVTSAAFEDGAAIPKTYTCSGDGASPPLSWSEGPDDTASFAIVVDDPDAPKKVWVHWVAWGLPPDLRALDEGITADDDRFTQGTNDNGKQSWSPPCPPKTDATHRYVFHVFAADTVPELPRTTTRDQLYRALDHHVLAMGELTGHFDR